MKLPTGIYISNQMNQNNMAPEKIRIRKQSALPVKPIIQLKLLGMITIDFCNIVVVHIYGLFGP